MRPRLRYAFVLSVLAAQLSAQGTPRAPTPDTLPRPTAAPADVSSPDAIIAALYDVISGGAGQSRDWNRFRSLFAPHARLMPVVNRPDGGASVAVLSVEDYVARAGPGLERSGFFERELNRVSETFGNAMHAFSTYDSRRTSDVAEKPFARGINSIQMLKDGSRWWIVSVFWDAEKPGLEIPAKYLPQ
jgi:hypothetical protein